MANISITAASVSVEANRRYGSSSDVFLDITNADLSMIEAADVVEEIGVKDILSEIDEDEIVENKDVDELLKAIARKCDIGDILGSINIEDVIDFYGEKELGKLLPRADTCAHLPDAE